MIFTPQNWSVKLLIGWQGSFLVNIFIWMKTEESGSSIGLKLFILKQEKKDLSILVQHRITMNLHS